MITLRSSQAPPPAPKSCPFCGWGGTKTTEDAAGACRASCPHCGATGPTTRSPSAALVQWNLRSGVFNRHPQDVIYY